jgi:hypothetical protein
MNAQEARSLTRQYYHETTKGIYDDIIELIKDRCKIGVTFLKIQESDINDRCIDVLRGDGYIVGSNEEEFNGFKMVMFTITW